MRSDIRRRLRQLGVVKGVRELAALPPRPRVAIEDLVSGRFHTTSRGRCFVVEESYPLDHLHGELSLSTFLDLSPEIAAQVAREDRLTGIDLRRACFLDTETTGLSGGTGTMAFVVGLGFFQEQAFHVHQYFLRDPGDEPAMIETLAAQLPEFQVLISFNGVAFDVPILENRFILGRIPPPTATMPHFDLLPPTRRLWRYGLPSCALGTLERQVLGVFREQDDVRSGIIPFLYRDYLRTGDAREMKRVLYHNVIDILSLVTLAARLCNTFADPWARQDLGGAELYGLGRWYAGEGRLAETERAYRAALGAGLTPELRARVLRDLGYLLKRADRRDEAFAYWQQLALETPDDILGWVEVAKHLEWHVRNLDLAAGWTQVALTQVEGWPGGQYRSVTLDELRHRLARIDRKIAGSRVSDTEIKPKAE
jgi:uncharacterized protein YprB with RNaseH-like and TPR domain